MSYQWPVVVTDLFGERYPQMVNTGLSARDVDAVRAAITDMWPDAPGGWVYEWSRLAARYADDGDHQLAALAYGWAKFPTLADEAKRTALANQLEQYQLAAPTFGVGFERTVFELPYDGGTTSVPVHILTPPGISDRHPVVLFSGGVDSWKMDLHAMMEVLAVTAQAPVMAFDIPGTGESAVPMTPDGGAEIVRGLVEQARELGNGSVVHVGVSMGGYFSARTGLAGEVDAAIVLGGPVEHAFTGGAPSHFGMSGIVFNAMGFSAEPDAADVGARFAGFSLRGLLDADTNVPMLVINGEDDVHVPQHDTLVFRGRRNTEVHLLADTGHCAVSKFGEAITLMSQWLGRTLTAPPAGLSATNT